MALENSAPQPFTVFLDAVGGLRVLDGCFRSRFRVAPCRAGLCGASLLRLRATCFGRRCAISVRATCVGRGLCGIDPRGHHLGVAGHIHAHVLVHDAQLVRHGRNDRAEALASLAGLSLFGTDPFGAFGDQRDDGEVLAGARDAHHLEPFLQVSRPLFQLRFGFCIEALLVGALAARDGLCEQRALIARVVVAAGALRFLEDRRIQHKRRTLQVGLEVSHGHEFPLPEQQFQTLVLHFLAQHSQQFSVAEVDALFVQGLADLRRGVHQGQTAIQRGA